ncbi:heparin lyase I family protein [uncultured Streptomyces sp.]|uniref:heparin lyase I family protein n=1 Tax=uncultured Streptomyces sp. TaxID=174707 RepID=UPI002619E9E0|nr:heparin lyase I family protein [uncultured Streptomyces sp.]
MRTRALLLPTVASAIASLLLASPAHASTIWNGDAGSGTGVFRTVECDAPGSLTAATSGGNTYWRMDKPAGPIRCEARGVKVGGSAYLFQNNSTYYLGWSSYLTVTDGDFVTFQWKSYPGEGQNYPLIMTVKDGALRLFHIPQGATESWQLLWSTPVTPTVWNRIGLAVHTSDSASDGWAELWYNGVRQTFSTGSTRFTGRTWNTYNDPKWGVYDRDAPEHAADNRVDDLRIGTAYADIS